MFNSGKKKIWKLQKLDILKTDPNEKVYVILVDFIFQKNILIESFNFKFHTCSVNAFTKTKPNRNHLACKNVLCTGL